MRILIPMIAVAATLTAFNAEAYDARSADGAIRNSMVIEFADLDIRTERDARILLQRIERGAKKACGGHRAFNSVTGRLDGSFDRCRDAAIRDAVEKLNTPLVTHLYSQACEKR